MALAGIFKPFSLFNDALCLVFEHMIIHGLVQYSGGFPGGSAVKNLPAMQETKVRSQGWEDLLEKEMATQPLYSCLGNPMDREAWRATVHGFANESDTT